MTASPLVLVLMAAGFLTHLMPPAGYAADGETFRMVNLGARIAFSTAAIWAVIMLAPAGMAPFIYFQF